MIPRWGFPCFSAAVALAACGMVRANNTALAAGGSPAALRSHPSVRMRSEKVRITIEDKRVTTDCAFVFENTGPACTVRMGFPDRGFGAFDPDEEHQHDWRARPPRSTFESFMSWVDGAKVATKLIRSNKPGGFWHAKTVRFAAHGRRTVRDLYTTEVGFAETGHGREYRASYVLQTGASWHGRIGRTEVIVTFERRGMRAPLRPAPARQVEGAWSGPDRDWSKEQGRVFYVGPCKPRVRGSSLVFVRKNWRPTSASDIHLVFDLARGDRTGAPPPKVDQDRAAAIRLKEVTAIERPMTTTGTTEEIINGWGVRGLALSADGRMAALEAGLSHGEICVWSLPDRRRVASLTYDHREYLRALVLSPNGRTVAVDTDRAVMAWDVPTARRLAVIPGRCTALGFADAGRKLLVLREDGTLVVWTADRGLRRRRIKSARMDEGIFLPDGRTVVGLRRKYVWRSSADVDLVVVDLFSGRTRRYPRVAQESRVQYFTVSRAAGRAAFFSWYDGLTTVFDFRAGKRVVKRPVKQWPTKMELSPDGRVLALGFTDNRLALADAATGRILAATAPESDTYDALCWSPDGSSLAAATNDGRVLKVWRVRRSLPDVAPKHAVKAHTGPVTALAFSPDGRTLATGGWDGDVKLWDSATHKERWGLPVSRKVCSLAFSPDGKTLAAGEEDGTVTLWDTETGQEIRSFKEHPDDVIAVSFSPDGRTLATASGRIVRFWDAKTGREMRRFWTKRDWAESLAFSRDWKMFATQRESQPIELWNVAAGREIRRFGPLDGHTVGMAFAPDGRTVAEIRQDNAVYLWDAGTGRRKGVIPPQAAAIRQAAFSPDGRTLAAALADGAVRLWSLTARSPRRTTALGPSIPAFSLAFSPDGHALAAGCANGVAVLWTDMNTKPSRKDVTAQRKRANR
jgi:WD40 repeat protein